MAIKGKSRPKARHGVTSGPRTAYVHVKRPLPQRRWFQLTVLGTIVALSLGAIAYGVVKVRNEQRADALAAAYRRAMTEYSGAAEPALAGVGTSAPPASFDLQPQLQQQIDAFAGGDGDPADVERAAERYATDSEEAADALEGIDIAELVRGHGFDAGFVRDLFNATQDMRSGLQMNAEAARLLALAARLDGAARKGSLERATAVREIAASTFLSGYRDYVNAQAQAGTYQGVAPFQPPGAGRG